MADQEPKGQQEALKELQVKSVKEGKFHQAKQYGEERDKLRDVAPYKPELVSRTPAEDITEKQVQRKYKEGSSQYFDDLREGKISKPKTFEEYLEKYRYGYHGGVPELVDELEEMRKSNSDTPEQLITRRAEELSKEKEIHQAIEWLNHPDNQNPLTAAEHIEVIQHEVKAGLHDLDDVRDRLAMKNASNIDVIYELAQQRYEQSRQKKRTIPTT
jgi:hypothetical protein